MSNSSTVSIVVPVFNEHGNIGVLAKAIDRVFANLPYTYTLLFVDDGSTDGSINTIKLLAEYNPSIQYISLSRNFGHQQALKAGIDKAEGDCIICMDGDMQHPPTLIPQMLEQWENGYDIVYTTRQEDESLPFIKRATSKMFYRVINMLSDITLEAGSSDFRLIGKNVATVIRDLKEGDLFIRGMVKWVGFRQTSITYRPSKRFNGTSKYSLKKMMALALQGITSFSTRPLYIAAYLGFIFSALSVLYAPYVIISYAYGHPISGWASVIVTIAFFGGLQLMILGIIGVYLGKLFMQSKQRPFYIIKEENITCSQQQSVSY